LTGLPTGLASSDLRVLLTTHAFLPASVAGVEVYTARLGRALQDLGHTVRVLTAAHDLSAPAHTVRRRQVGPLDSVEIVNTHLEGTLAATYRVTAIDRAITQTVEEFRPDVVHVQHLLNLSTGLLDAAQASGAPVAFTLHDYWLSCPRDGLRMRADGALCDVVDHGVCADCLKDSPYLVPAVQRGATRAAQATGLGRALHLARRRAPRLADGVLRAVRRAWPPTGDLRPALDERAAHLHGRVREVAAFLAPTAFARDRAVEWGVPASSVRVMSLGAVTHPPRPRRAGPRPRFGYVGTMAPHKGPHVLLEAIAGASGSEWTLDLFGNLDLDPVYGRRLRALARGNPRIRFRGPVPPDEQERMWAAIDVLVVPSLWWENSPLTVLEALAAGVPVVASRTGGVPEVIPEGAGLLVAPGDVAALRAALQGFLDGRLLAGPLDPLPVKTAADGAHELAALYAELVSRSRRTA
jgi:glycosyltransferase involved in cell wall biosynthesis